LQSYALQDSVIKGLIKRSAIRLSTVAPQKGGVIIGRAFRFLNILPPSAFFIVALCAKSISDEFDVPVAKF
jgi:hypothetical protein